MRYKNTSTAHRKNSTSASGAYASFARAVHDAHDRDSISRSSSLPESTSLDISLSSTLTNATAIATSIQIPLAAAAVRALAAASPPALAKSPTTLPAVLAAIAHACAITTSSLARPASPPNLSTTYPSNDAYACAAPALASVPNPYVCAVVRAALDPSAPASATAHPSATCAARVPPLARDRSLTDAYSGFNVATANTKA